MAEKGRRYEVVNGFNIGPKDERHEIGEVIELSDADAESLIALGAVKEVTNG